MWVILGLLLTGLVTHTRGQSSQVEVGGGGSVSRVPEEASATWQPRVVLDIGPDVGEVVPSHLRRHLSRWLPKAKDGVGAADVLKLLMNETDATPALQAPLLLISVGDTATWRALMAAGQHNWAAPTIDSESSGPSLMAIDSKMPASLR